MKKVGLLLIVIIFLLVGCSNGKNVNTSEETGDIKTSDHASVAKGYIFENNGIVIGMNEKTDPILKSLGDAKEYFEAESCAFQGMDKTYTYNGFELHTYEIDKIDYVATVIFLDDSVSTKEGISLNADLTDVIKAYGDKYTNKSNLYTYQLDKSKISFIMENDKVTSIEYTAITE